MAMNDQTLTTGQIAKYCRVNYQTVIRWIKRGRLKAHQLPGRGDHRVEVEDFLQFLRDHQLPIPIELEGTAKRILVVDDDPSITRAIGRVLQKHGYETAVASNGFEAGALLKSFQPSLITLDLEMPGLGGLDVVKFVRSTDNGQAIKILIVSGMELDQLHQAVDAGADDYLEKPVKNKSLIEKVEALLGDGH